MTNQTTVKKYGLVGINDDETVCSVCGRVELKRVMWLVELDDSGGWVSEPFPVGTSCGARMLGYTQSVMSTKAKNYAGQVWRKREQLRYGYEYEHGYYEVIERLHVLNLAYAERCAHPLYAEMEAIGAAAKAYADAQVITVTL